MNGRSQRAQIHAYRRSTIHVFTRERTDGMELALPLDMPTTRYLVRSNLNPKMVYCTDGEFHHEIHIGPGTTKTAKLYKSERAAGAVRGGTVTVHACDEYGVEVVA